MKLIIDIPNEVLEQAKNRKDTRKIVECGIVLPNNTVLVTKWETSDAGSDRY